MKPCPHCGASLHEEASFCPYCAQTVNPRKEVHPPRHMSRRALYSALIVLIATAVLLAVWMYTRPKVYDTGTAEVIYPMDGQHYQLCISSISQPFIPAPQRYSSGWLNRDGRIPAMLYIHHAESDSDAQTVFLKQVDNITAEFVQVDEDLQISCTEPAAEPDYAPLAARVIYVDYCPRGLGDHTAQLVFTISMKNGDVIRVRQELTIETMNVYDYWPEDGPMDTLEEVQALADWAVDQADPEAEINLHLPPVVYEGTLTLDKRGINLYGSTDDQGNRTTFTGSVQMPQLLANISYIEDIDFVGSGEGIGISSSARLFLTNCRIAGWRTGVLGYGYGWTLAQECTFENNETAFHFNSIGDAVSVTGTRYSDNEFRGNGTAVLLEQVPTDITLVFSGTRFEGNGQDIDNRCGQALDLDGAVFQ